MVVFQDVGAPLPCPHYGNSCFDASKDFTKSIQRHTLQNLKYLCPIVFFDLVLWGKMCQNIKNTASCSRKLKIKETFEKVSHDFGCKVALAFHSS